jgi:glycosyltransferase involved in cell wall biosynthesis
MSNKPLVSICSPCYNHEKYLEDYFLGIINQTYDNLELILIDDCSTDSSVDIIRRWMPQLKKRFKNVIFIENDVNLGVVRNCNKTLTYAQGEYIRFLATDDTLLKHDIQSKVSLMEEHKDWGICYGRAIVVDKDFHYGDDTRNKYITPSLPRIMEGDQFFKKLLYGNFIYALTVMFRKSIFDTFGYFDENIEYEDYEYWLRISRFIKAGYANLPSACYRKSENSLTDYRGKKGRERFCSMYAGSRKILKKYLKYIEPENRDKYINSFYLRTLREAINYRHKDMAMKLYRIVRRRGCQIPAEQRKDLYLLMINPFY